MRAFGQYLWQRRWVAAAFAAFAALFAAVFALYELPLAAVAYPTLLCGSLALAFAAVDFLRQRARRRQLALLQKNSDILTLPDALPPPQTALEADYQALVGMLQKRALALEEEAEARYRDTVDYYTTWAHQIKTPIAAMHLTLQNEDSPTARRLQGELFRIEQYVEMVMTFLRLGSPSTDYVFRSCCLDDILREAAKKFAPVFIDRHIRLDYTPVQLTVVTDGKWLSFVVEQLLSNALKYTPEGGVVRLFLRDGHTLCIQDTGIGIEPQDLPRVCEKGYTGVNGRQEKSASGLGLYLCKRICDGLGVGLALDSRPGEGTLVALDMTQYPLRGE